MLSTLQDVLKEGFGEAVEALSTLQDVLKEGFGEAVAVHDVTKPCEFPSLDSYQKRSLWAHQEVDLAPHPVVGL